MGTHTFAFKAEVDFDGTFLAAKLQLNTRHVCINSLALSPSPLSLSLSPPSLSLSLSLSVWLGAVYLGFVFLPLLLLFDICLPTRAMCDTVVLYVFTCFREKATSY